MNVYGDTFLLSCVLFREKGISVWQRKFVSFSHMPRYFYHPFQPQPFYVDIRVLWSAWCGQEGIKTITLYLPHLVSRLIILSFKTVFCLHFLYLFCLKSSGCLAKNETNIIYSPMRSLTQFVRFTARKISNKAEQRWKRYSIINRIISVMASNRKPNRRAFNVLCYRSSRCSYSLLVYFWFSQLGYTLHVTPTVMRFRRQH